MGSATPVDRTPDPTTPGLLEVPTHASETEQTTPNAVSPHPGLSLEKGKQVLDAAIEDRWREDDVQDFIRHASDLSSVRKELKNYWETLKDKRAAKKIEGLFGQLRSTEPNQRESRYATERAAEFIKG